MSCGAFKRHRHLDGRCVRCGESDRVKRAAARARGEHLEVTLHFVMWNARAAGHGVYVVSTRDRTKQRRLLGGASVLFVSHDQRRIDLVYWRVREERDRRLRLGACAVRAADDVQGREQAS